MPPRILRYVKDHQWLHAYVPFIICPYLYSMSSANAKLIFGTAKQKRGLQFPMQFKEKAGASNKKLIVSYFIYIIDRYQQIHKTKNKRENETGLKTFRLLHTDYHSTNLGTVGAMVFSLLLCAKCATHGISLLPFFLYRETIFFPSREKNYCCTSKTLKSSKVKYLKRMIKGFSVRSVG